MTHRMKATTLLLVLLFAAPLSLAQDTPAVTPDPATEAAPEADAKIVVADDLVSALEAAEQFTVLVQALRDTGLDAALSGTETFTVFAPTDEAFAKLPAGTLDALTPDELTRVLRYHVLMGTVTSADAAALTAAPTVEGSEIKIAMGDALTVNDATVTEADLEVSNGVIHVIDTVLMPGPAEATLEGKAAGGKPAKQDAAPTERADDQEDDTEQNDSSEASPEPTDDQR